MRAIGHVWRQEIYEKCQFFKFQIKRGIDGITSILGLFWARNSNFLVSRVAGCRIVSFGNMDFFDFYFKRFYNLSKDLNKKRCF